MEDQSCCKGHGHLWIKMVGILALCAIVIVAILRDKIVNPQFRSITVMGQGKVSYSPDTAVVNLGVQIDKAAKPDEAMSKLNEKMGKIIAAVKALGVADENITTQNFYLNPQYDYRPIPLGVVATPMSYSVDAVGIGGGAPAKTSSAVAPAREIAVSSQAGVTMVSYSANQQLLIKIKDLQNNKDLLNKVVGKATEAGANQIQGITFEASNLDDLKQQARVKAIGDARGKATALAEAAGVKLKDITGWYENFFKGGYYGADSAMGIGGGGGSMPQIMVGDNEVMVEIGVTYNIKD